MGKLLDQNPREQHFDANAQKALNSRGPSIFQADESTSENPGEGEGWKANQITNQRLAGEAYRRLIKGSSLVEEPHNRLCNNHRANRDRKSNEDNEAKIAGELARECLKVFF